MPSSSADSGGDVAKPIVRADAELRAFAAGWCAAAVLTFGAAVALGVDNFSPLEVDATAILLGSSLLCALAGVFLGRRTGPVLAYRQLFDHAPMAPRSARGESNGRTVRRALTVALVTAAVFVPVAFVLLGLGLLLLGKPWAELFDHLPAAAGLVAAGWMLACGIAARVVAGWFERWERARGKVILCHPMRSGTVAHVYYVAAERPPQASD